MAVVVVQSGIVRLALYILRFMKRHIVLIPVPQEESGSYTCNDQLIISTIVQKRRFLLGFSQKKVSNVLSQY